MKCPNCGFVLDGHASRSPQDHRRFFAVIRATYTHWPESHEFDPDNAEHLRKWLLCKAGFRDVTTIPVDFPIELAKEHPALMKLVMLAVEAAIKAAKGYAFPRIHGDCIAVFSAKSIQWDKIDQKEFNKVREAVEEVIEAETGLKPDQLLKETEKAA